MSVILAVDGGGSRTRCLAIDKAGRVLGRGEGGPSNHLLIDRAAVLESLAAAIGQALAAARLNQSDLACVSAGLAGVDSDGAGTAEAARIFADVGLDGVVVNGDMVIAHRGALAFQPGVVALAGTGSSVLGIGSNGTRIKVGGWGPVYGNEGSAYQIAQLGLRAAARAYDGSGPATALLNAIVGALGLSDFRETVAAVYASCVDQAEVAALGPVVTRAADAGDTVARHIVQRAGEELAESVGAALFRLALGQDDRVVSYQGAVLKSCTLLRTSFCEALGARVPGVRVYPPRFEPVIGAYLLGCEALGWTSPLSALPSATESPR